MGNTVEHSYRGWDITIRCMQRLRPIDELNFVTRYSVAALATLQETEDPADWIDPRVQIVTLGSREFDDSDRCINALLGEVKELIDALKR